MEKSGNWIDTILDSNPYSSPFSRLGKIRSSGITDLRYGNITEDDWKERDRFEQSGDKRIPVSLPKNVGCYTVATTIAKETNKLDDGIVGDGLVPVKSALGIHKKKELNLSFTESHQYIFRNMKHLDLLSSFDVYETIKNRL